MTLLELAERVEKATGSDWELERAIKAALEGREYISFQDDLANRNGATPPRYTSSLDAAMTLVPSWACPHIRWDADEWKWGCQLENTLNLPFGGYKGLAATPALALTAACLRVRHDR